MVVTPQLIRSTAIAMANEIGIINLTRMDLCTKLKIADGSFTVIAGQTFTQLIEEIRPECSKFTGAKSDKKSRASKEIRLEHILGVALDVAEKSGFSKLSRTEVAEQCGVSSSLIQYHFKTIPNFKRDVMRYAIKTERLSVIAEGLATRNPHALKAPQELKDRAIASLGQ